MGQASSQIQAEVAAQSAGNRRPSTPALTPVQSSGITSPLFTSPLIPPSSPPEELSATQAQLWEHETSMAGLTELAPLLNPQLDWVGGSGEEETESIEVQVARIVEKVPLKRRLQTLQELAHRSSDIFERSALVGWEVYQYMLQHKLWRQHGYTSETQFRCQTQYDTIYEAMLREGKQLKGHKMSG